MAPNGGQESHDIAALSATAEMLGEEANEVKSYDYAIPSAQDLERSHTEQRAQPQDLKSTSGFHTQDRSDPPDLHSDGIAPVGHEANEPPKLDPNSTPTDVTQTMPNGDGDYNSGADLLRSSCESPGVLDAQRPEFSNDSRPPDPVELPPKPSSHPIPASTKSPMVLWSNSEDVTNEPFFELERETELTIPQRIDGDHLGSPAHSPFPGEAPNGFPSQPELDQDDPNHLVATSVPQLDHNEVTLMTDAQEKVVEDAQAEDNVVSFVKQVQRCRKRIDGVLLKRTQWRQENQKLEDCRRYLSQSTEKLKSAILDERETDGPLVTPKTKKKKKKKKKSERLEKVSLTADEPDGQRVDSGVDNIEHDLKGSEEDSENTANSRPNIAALYERYLEDLASLNRQEEAVKKLMEDLSNREFHLNHLYEDIKRKMHSQNFANEFHAEMLDESLISPGTSSRAQSENDIPTLIADYFNAQGNVGVFRERLQELDWLHQDGRTERQFLRDQGEELKVSDDDFETNFRTERHKIEDDLNREQEQVVVLARRCKEAGLDPEIYRHAARSTGSASPSRSIQDVQTSVLPLEETSESEPHRPPSPPAAGQTPWQIEGWLRTVPVAEQPLPPPDIQPFDSSRRSSEASVDKRTNGFSLASFEFHSFHPARFGFPQNREPMEFGV